MILYSRNWFKIALNEQSVNLARSALEGETEKSNDRTVGYDARQKCTTWMRLRLTGEHFVDEERKVICLIVLCKG